MYSATMPLAAAETLNDISKALDGGTLYIAMSTGRWWRLRRNGRTKLWVRRPDEWAIPVKYGMKGHATITQAWKLGEEFDYAERIPAEKRA